MYTNTEMIIDNLRKELEAITDIVHTKEIIDDSDGCSEQYQCGTALYILQKFVKEKYTIHDRATNAEGHDKNSINGLSGWREVENSRNVNGGDIDDDDHG